MTISSYTSPIGEITLAVHGGKLIGLWFVGQKYDREGLFEAEIIPDDEIILIKAKAWLDDYFSGKRPKMLVEIEPNGTAFQKRVWQALLSIPYGETRSYGEIAEQIFCRSARAVGTAIGRNPISIIIPCHRVVGSNGSLTGYAGGIDRKRALLEIERT